MRPEDNEPRYVISVAARMLGVQTHSLRYYEKLGIIEPSRSRGNIRLYSDKDIAYLKQLKALMNDLGINLAGVEVILRLAERLAELQRRIDELESELRQLKEEEA
ncbi:MAG: MerR family transcriptional regulator [Dehalococcoidales bacterium]|jgi:MerR family transcriptional regulator/heat shock protein HspR|nr:MerR family transcriptional regulator [Dehalococcoidales bacterium]